MNSCFISYDSYLATLENDEIHVFVIRLKAYSVHTTQYCPLYLNATVNARYMHGICTCKIDICTENYNF